MGRALIRLGPPTGAQVRHCPTHFLFSGNPSPWDHGPPTLFFSLKRLNNAPAIEIFRLKPACDQGGCEGP